MSFKDEQPSNADVPMLVSLLVFKIICVKDEQFLKEQFGMTWISLLRINDFTPRNAFCSIVWIDDGIVISFKEEQPSKADDPIDINLSVLKMIFVSDEQFLKELLGRYSISLFIVNTLIPWKAFSLMVWTDDGIVILFKDKHLLKAEDPIVVKVWLFNDISFKEEHPSKADDPIELIVSELKVIFINEEQFKNELLGRSWILPFIVNALMPRKASLSIVLIVEGKVISTNEEHPSNADDPIVFNLFDLKTIDFKVEQFLNELLGIFW